MAENVQIILPAPNKVTILPAPVQQVHIKTGPETIITSLGAGGANAFGIINVTGQANVIATTNSDILRMVAGSGISVTTDAPNNSITIIATGGLSQDQYARDTANASFLKANTANVTGEAAFAKANLANTLAQSSYDTANTAIYTAAQIRANVSNTAPINYDSTTGVFSHATSGVTATTYGNTTFVPSVTVDARGHITGVVNTAIAFPAAVDQFARDNSNGAYTQANTANVTGEAAFARANAAYANANTAIYTAAQIRANVSNTTPILYDPATGIFSLTTVPVTLGGTGQISYANGELLIGNTISGGLDRANLTQGRGIIITNEKGKITIDAATGVVYYLENGTLSDVGTYHKLLTSPSTLTENTISHAATGTLSFTLLSSFITDAAEPNVTLLPPGTYGRHLHVTTGASNQVGRLRIELYKYAANTLETLLRTGDSPDFWLGNETPLVAWNVTDATGYPLAATDRLLAKVYAARVSGPATCNIDIFTQGVNRASYVTTTILEITGSSIDQFARDRANAAYTQANTANVTGEAAFARANAAYANANTAIYTAAQIRANISNTTPINYDAVTGVISHAASGITATGYGSATQIPVVVVNATGHVTSVVNTAIAGLDAAVITTGRLTVPRGGTGLSPTIVNGALLIGNTVNSGFDLNTIANTGIGGILVTNGQGTITLAANLTWVRGNVGAVAPITYTQSNGNFTHDGSGVTATGYGSATQIPVVVVNATGHVTSVVNTAIAGLDAGVITTGTLVVARGGTGQTSYANGELLIGNTISGGLDKRTLTQGTGILITNGNGTITIDATGGSSVDQYARDKANGAVQLGYPRINVAANATLVAATTNNDTLILVQGAGILLTPNAANHSIAITATGGAATDQYARDKANGAVQLGYPRINVASNSTLVAATTNNDILVLLPGIDLTMTSNAAQSSITIGHGTSGVAATGYGTATQIPVLVVNDRGHITSVTNTAIAGLDAGVITTGRVTVPRGGTGLTPTIVNGAILIGNTVNSGFDLNTIANTGTGGILITNGQGTITLGANVIWMRGNLAAVTPLTYTASNGTFTHAGSGITATGYGTATQIPVLVVNETGHLTSVTNTAIAGLDAGVITTGRLTVPRGGTGLSPTITNGAILIGNTVNSGFDLNTIANTGTGGILITNGQGTITLAANVIWMRGNIGAVAPLTYTASNGNFTHDGSGVTATGYGTATQIPVFVVNQTGHVTLVTNTAIAGLDAAVITTGRLTVPRGGTGLSPTIVNGAILIGNTVNSGFDLNTIANTGTGGILVTNGQGTITLAANVLWVRGNVGAVTPITYTQSNGTFTHAGSGVTATGYGTATQIPVFVVNETGHVTLVTNTAIAGLDAGVITTGRLTVPRGGTGLTPTIVNGAILIGNTVNSGFDLNTIANTGTGGILITNGQGTITLAANVLWVRGNVGAVTPITYTQSNGTFTHAGSGVTATGYGTATQIPVLVVNETGHVTGVVNTAIAGLDAGVITTGRLVVARGGTGLTPTIVNGAILIGNTVNSGFDLNTIANTGTGGILITNGQGTITLAANVLWVRGNVGAVTPIAYTQSNGNFTHAGSGVTATGYGTATLIPVFVVNETGHVTSVVNTAIAGLDAGVMTTGTLPYTRGGTGRSLTGVSNGQLLIGNTTNNGFDLATLTQGSGILITNGNGTITVAATGGSAVDQYARDKANGAVQLGYPRINVAANATLVAATTNNDILYFLAGAGLTLTSNAAQSSLTFNTSRPYLKSVAVMSPNVSDNISLCFTDVPVTWRQVVSVVQGTATPNVQVRLTYANTRTPGTVGTPITADFFCANTTNGVFTTSFTNATVPANNYIVLQFPTITGTVTEFDLTLMA